MMITPNGRFQTNTRLCLSISDFHPGMHLLEQNIYDYVRELESTLECTIHFDWITIIHGMASCSFLLTLQLDNQSTYGSISTTDDQKRQFARDTIEFNRKDKIFKLLFSELLQSKIEESEKLFARFNQDTTSNKNTSSTPPNNGSSWITKLFHFTLFAIVVSFIAYLAY
jgi:ubiquitin-conjugating enzyme E2 J2